MWKKLLFYLLQKFTCALNKNVAFTGENFTKDELS